MMRVVKLVFLAAALLAPVVAPNGPFATYSGVSLKPPSPEHPFGTDRLARDELARVLYGAQISLYVGVVSVVMGLSIGSIIGALAGAFGGKVDELVPGPVAARFREMFPNGRPGAPLIPSE